MNFTLDGQSVDSIELKCMIVSRGLKIDKAVYQRCGKNYRIYPDALTCNCFKLPDDTIVMATDLGFHLSTLSFMFSWDNLKLFKYMSDMKTDFRLSLNGDIPTLYYKGKEVTPIKLMPGTRFYEQKTTSGMPYAGNAVLQGCDWVAFQCLWPCEYARAGKPCQYCFSGGQFEALTKRGIIPSASVWIPFGKPVNGSMKPPSLDYYRRVKEMLADLYIKYNLKPAGCCGFNVCVEKDIWRWARGA